MDNASDRNPEDLLREIREKGISQSVCVNDLGMSCLIPYRVSSLLASLGFICPVSFSCFRSDISLKKFPPAAFNLHCCHIASSQLGGLTPSSSRCF
jgi:hypothetical protein